FGNGHSFCWDFSLERTLRLCWTLGDDVLAVELQYPQEGVWIGWAVAVEGHEMTDADAVIGSSRGVERYIMSRRDSGDPLETETIGLDDAMYLSDSNLTTVSFSRLVDAAGDARDITFSDIETIIVAVGTDDGGELEVHTRDNDGHVHVTFAGGAIPPSPSPTFAPVTFQPSSSSDVYDFCTELPLEKPLRFCWRLSSTRLDVKLEYPEEGLWVGWAPATEGHRMTNADAVIGSSRGVERYVMSERDTGDPQGASTVDLADESYYSSNGWSTLTFSRRLEALGGARDVSVVMPETIIVAVGEDDDGVLREHGRHQHGYVNVLLTEGVVAPTPAPVPAPDGGAADDGVYQFCTLIPLTHAVQMCWRERETRLELRLEWCGEDTWIGWAVAVRGYDMNGADAVIGSSRGVERYKLSRTSQGSPIDTAPIGLSDEAYISDSGSSVLLFSRSWDAAEGAEDVSRDGLQSIIIAVGDVDGDQLREHSPQNSIGIDVDFATGEVDIEREDPYVVAHGALLALAWYLYAPLSLIAAAIKHSGRFPKMAGHLHKIHVGAGIATAINTIGGVAVLAAVKDSSFEETESDAEKDQYRHAVLGVCVTLFVGLQTMMGFLRPPAGGGGEVGRKRQVFNWTHRVLGHLALLLGQIDIILGIDLVSDRGYRYADGALTAFIVLLVLLWLLILVGRACLLLQPQDEEKASMLSKVAAYEQAEQKDERQGSWFAGQKSAGIVAT
ncbi:MAG: hypothetical protein AAFN41_09860, partial [Planctomycetota bacterium]